VFEFCKQANARKQRPKALLSLSPKQHAPVLASVLPQHARHRLREFQLLLTTSRTVSTGQGAPAMML
jgi:hypothetical protein